MDVEVAEDEEGVDAPLSIGLILAAGVVELLGFPLALEALEVLGISWTPAVRVAHSSVEIKLRMAFILSFTLSMRSGASLLSEVCWTELG